jgi:predicted amidohydrolase YtcJ
MKMKILHNVRIHTLDASAPTASVLVIDRDRIIAVGGIELLDQFPFAEKEDLGGRVVLPGLTDAHIHMQWYSLGLQKVDCETGTREECLRRIAERARVTPPGEWILGHGWQQNDWDGEFPTASQLDAAAPNHPVYLTAKSLHAGWANALAFKQAGITAATSDPENGKIMRDPHGVPNGILLEKAMDLFDKALPAVTLEQLINAIQAAQPLLWKMGLTGIHDFDQRLCFMAMQVLHQRRELKLRTTKSIPMELLQQAYELGLRSGFGDDMLQIGSVKIFMDGALGPRTAAMFQPYENEPGNHGILNMDSEELYEIGRQAVDAGLSVAVHAIGDRANHEVLDAFEQLRSYEREKNLPLFRHRIEHVQVLHPDDAARLGKLGVIASMQPIHAISDMQAADKFWGARSSLAYAWRTQLLSKAVLAFGSDAPVESPNPFLGLHAAITRRRPDGTPSPQGWYPEQRLSLLEAWQGFTSGAACAGGMEDRLGKLSAGFYADLIALEKDPFTCEPDELLKMQSSATMVNGEWVWQS